MILLLFPRRELHTYPSSCRCLYAPTNAPVQAPRVGYNCGSVTQVSREPTRVLTKSFHLRLTSPTVNLPRTPAALHHYLSGKERAVLLRELEKRVAG